MITKKDIFPIILIAAGLSIGIYLLPVLPGKVPSHWNFYGDIDGWLPKKIAVYLFPLLTLFVYALLSVLPFFDPYKKNYQNFLKEYFWLRFGVVIFLMVLYAYTILAAFGYSFDIYKTILPLMSFGMMLLGFFLPKVKRNYFVGIRTPWTLQSENIWDRTHKVSGYAFIIAGFLSLMGFGFLPSMYGGWLLIISMVAAGLHGTIYSYILYRKENDKISNNQTF